MDNILLVITLIIETCDKMSEEEVVKLCGKQTINQIKADEIALLLGISQSLKDGDTSVEELMAPIRGSREAKLGKINAAAARAASAKTAQGEAAGQPAPEAVAEVPEGGNSLW